jgi:hypothetical protein
MKYRVLFASLSAIAPLQKMNLNSFPASLGSSFLANAFAAARVYSTDTFLAVSTSGKSSTFPPSAL